MDPVIITAAICGAEVTKEQNPNVPYTVEEIAEEARKAYEAGASIIHLHVRDDDGVPTQDYRRFKACMEAIYKCCPQVIIQPSTGGAVGMSIEERAQPLNLLPEMATLDCGTLNFGGDDIFINTENQIKSFAELMSARCIKPELECFDKGMIDTVLRLHKKNYISGPLHFSFVLGVPGGMTGSMRDFIYMRESIPRDASFSVAGVGRYEFPLATMSLLTGGHARVGFEDNLYIEKGVLAESNGQLVEKVVRLAKELGREIATPQQARDILHIKEVNHERMHIRNPQSFGA